MSRLDASSDVVFIPLSVLSILIVPFTALWVGVMVRPYDWPVLIGGGICCILGTAYWARNGDHNL